MVAGFGGAMPYLWPMQGIVIRGIDNAAHAGGLAAGYLLGRVFVDREPVTGPERKRAYLLGWIAGFIVVAAFGAMITKRILEGS